MYFISHKFSFVVLLSFFWALALVEDVHADITVSVGGVTYQITTVTGSYVAEASLLQSQTWWGNQTLATSLATAVGSGFGYVNQNPNVGPAFVYGTPTSSMMGPPGSYITAVSAAAPIYNQPWLYFQPLSTLSSTFAVVIPTSTNILPGSTNLLSSLGSALNPVFEGGTLKADTVIPVTTAFTIKSTGGKIDANGLRPVFSGAFADDTGVHGKLIITTPTSGTGTVVLAATNTHSGGTEVQAGANLSIASGAALGSGTLALAGSSTVPATLSTTATTTINNQITVAGDPVFNIAPTTITTVSLPIIDGASSGDVVVSGGGTLNLTATNTYTGLTRIDAGSTLALSGSGAIAASNGVVENGTLDISATTVGATVNALTGSGVVVLGTKSLTITNASGTFSGEVGGTGGLNIASGSQTLSGANTYTGLTTIDAGSTLALSGSGSIAQSSGVANSGTFDISATTNGATVKAISGSGAVALGSKNLTVSNASGIFSGSIAGTGGLNITGGSQTLSGANTYTGATSVSSGSTLALSGAGSIATSSGVTNNGTFNVTGKTGNVSVANYTQSSTGNLAMNFSPSNTQKLVVSGTASLAGGLNLAASSGTYQSGKYALLSASGVTGTFGSLSTNLSSYTTLGYALAYDASNVYLLFTPNTANTQQSLVNTASALQGTYTLQNAVLANSFSYDCTEFGINNICLSVGGRNTAVQAANGLNNTSGLLIAAYRPHPHYRMGAYADQNLSVSNPGGTINLGNNTPLIGVFGAWNQNLDGTGTEIKVSAAYGQKNATVTRAVVGTSEPGSGSSQLNSQGAQVTAKYGFAVLPQVIVSPYIGIRYTQNNMGGYTEATSSTVTAPLTYSALNTNATTALAGLGASYKLTPVVTTFASAGVETDTNTANGTYSATGITGLTPINFNANPVKTRPTATVGAYYDIAKNQRLGITGIYRQEPYQAVSTTTVMATYMIGL